MRVIKLIVLLMLLGLQLSAQPYGNEWVNSNQTYFKFKVVENGIYRISRAELEAVGFPVSSVPANRIQLFRRGNEQAIRVNSVGGILESLEFYGRGNDGDDDLSLYGTVDNQVHPGRSLFTDSAAYFLTFQLDNSSGRRMESYSEANTQGLPVEEYYTERNLMTFQNVYERGRAFNGGDIVQSTYDRGEGWVAAPLNSRNGESQDLVFNLINGTTNIGSPSIDMTIVGANNNVHRVQVEAGPNTASLRPVGDISFAGRDHRRVNLNLNWSDVGPDANLVVRVRPIGDNDRIAVSTAELSFPRAFILGGNGNVPLTLPANETDRSFIRVTQTPSNPALFDITDPNSPVEIGINASAGSFLAVIRNTAEERALFIADGTLSVNNIREVNMPNIDPAAHNYLIVSHPFLRSGRDEVARYANYRSSERGGGYNVLVSEIDDLFNLFSFGDQTPLAIRRFSDWMLDNGDPRFLFIIGKGLTPSANYYRLPDNVTSSLVNYVPTFGDPGTDIPFTSGLNEAGFESAIPTGRISAFTPEEVSAYLDKVIEMEEAPFTDFFRKRALLLSGGQTLNEQSSFRSFIEGYDNIISGDFLGGNSTLFSKTSNENVAFINVTEEINQGVSLVTFFGHSSATTSDIEVGLVSNPELGYANQGRYPIFLVNGCNAGNFYDQEQFNAERIFGDDWILTPDLGAIGFIASSSFALSNNLRDFSSLFLQNAYATDDFFGRSIGEIIQLTGREYIENFGTSQSRIAQVQQFALNGDPAVRLYGVTRADYDIQEEDISFQPIGEELIVATSDSFNIEIALKNFGRLVNEPVEVTVLRTLQDGTPITYGPVSYERVNSQDTLNFVIVRDPDLDETGTSLFEIFVDPQNLTDEVDETNNSVALTLDIFSGSTSNLYPLNFGIVPETSVDLLYQLSDLSSAERSVVIEIDTTAAFNSSLRNSSILQTDLLGRWSVSIDFPGLTDGQVFYWRTRLENPAPSESDEWVNSSFTFLSGSPEGWRQSTAAQLQNANFAGVSLSTSKTWSFETEETPIEVETFGVNFDPDFTADSVRVLVQGSNFLFQTLSSARFPPCADNTLNVMVFDRRSAQAYNPVFFPGEDLGNRIICGRRPQVVYNLFESDVTGIVDGVQGPSFLDSLINESEIGDVVLVFNIGNVNFSNWTEEIINKLGEIGIAPASINNLEDGQPVIFIGRKGSEPGTAFEFTDDGSGVPVTEQFFRVAQDIIGSNGEGSVESVRIGPANNWLSFQQQVNLLNSEDLTSVDVYGVNGSERDLLITDVGGSPRDLTGVDINAYPFLELEWNFSDLERQTPPQLASWQVLFETLPDGLLLDRNIAQQLSEGEAYRPEFSFHNYTTSNFVDSLEVAYTVFNRDSRAFLADTIMIAPPVAGDTISFSLEISTVGFIGANDVTIRVNTNEVPEQYLNNNTISRSSLLTVSPDQINPVLDVTFDGRYIRNGAVVSPNPTILMRLRDENEFFFKTDTSGVLVFLKPPCESCDFERIFFSDPLLSFTPATEFSEFRAIYTPQDLSAGTYSLRVQAEDASGNESGLIPFEIDFRVDPQSSIADLVAFPNPITDGVRFSFTLTGLTPPENMTVQIYSLKGELVRVIEMSELGELRIGANTTEVVWDGQDNQGRYVVNGVYIYRLSMSFGSEVLEGSEIQNGIGRLYLLR